MGSNINWIDERSPFKKEKDYLDSKSNGNGWIPIHNTFDILKCSACTRRIKVGQDVLWHPEEEIYMHRPKDCKMW